MTEFEELFVSEFKHSNLIIKRTGVHLCSDNLFLAASPDGILSCSCHGIAVVEVKCPYKYRNSTILAACKDPDFPLKYDPLEKKYKLLESHQYYYQTQLQMYVTGHHLCYFVVFTSIDLVYVKVPYNSELLQESIPITKKYFLEIVMPEALAGYYYLKSAVVPKSPPQNVFLPCYCQVIEPIVVTTVTCADENCLRKLFHLKCIHLQKNSPSKITKAWKCDVCRKSARIAAATKKKFLKEDEQTSKRRPLSTLNV